MWRKVGIGFAVLFVIGLIMRGFDAIGLIEIDPPEPTAEQKEAHTRIQQHAFNTGMASARAGLKKPTSDEVDAIARKAAAQLGEQPDLGFKTVWKQMFWEGWRKGGG